MFAKAAANDSDESDGADAQVTTRDTQYSLLPGPTRSAHASDDESEGAGGQKVATRDSQYSLLPGPTRSAHASDDEGAAPAPPHAAEEEPKVGASPAPGDGSGPSTPRKRKPVHKPRRAKTAREPLGTGDEGSAEGSAMPSGFAESGNPEGMLPSATFVKDKQFWMSDKNCKACYTCEKAFSFFNRRHHCRLCGQIFWSDNAACLPPPRGCSSCSAVTHALFTFGSFNCSGICAPHRPGRNYNVQVREQHRHSVVLTCFLLACDAAHQGDLRVCNHCHQLHLHSPDKRPKRTQSSKVHKVG